jgi:hypothetical protein
MRFLHAEQQAEQRGWVLRCEDSNKNRRGEERECSHVYAVCGKKKVFLCSFSALWLMGRERWTQLLDTLPVAEQEEVSA